jgi:hypothetical protein
MGVLTGLRSRAWPFSDPQSHLLVFEDTQGEAFRCKVVMLTDREEASRYTKREVDVDKTLEQTSAATRVWKEGRRVLTSCLRPTT